MNKNFVKISEDSWLGNEGPANLHESSLILKSNTIYLKAYRMYSLRKIPQIGRWI